MQHCQSCGTLLPLESQLCPRCGVSSFDPTIAPRERSQTQLAVPFSGMLAQNRYEQLYPFSAPPPPPPLLRTHITGRTILRLFFYLWGAFWLSIGLFAAFEDGKSNTIAGFSSIGSCVLSLIVLIFLLRNRKRVKLSTRRRLFIEIGLTLAGFLVFIFAAALMFSLQGVNSPVTSFVLGTIFMIYGLIAAFVAYW